jgi:hypothetical protein
MIKTMAIVNKLRSTGEISAKEALHLVGKLAVVLNSKRKKPIDANLITWIASAISGNIDKPLGVSADYLIDLAKVSGFELTYDDITGLFDLLCQQNNKIGKFIEIF